MSTASNLFSNETANITIQKREYPTSTKKTHSFQNLNSTATVTEVNEKPMDKMMLSSVHIETGQYTKEDFLFNSDIISLSEENDGNMGTPSNHDSTSCNNTTTTSFSPIRSTVDLEKPIPANILFDNGLDTPEVAAILPATLATPKRRGIVLHSSLFFSPLQRLDTGSSKKKKTSTSTSKKRSSPLLAIRYGSASATKNKGNKKRKTTPNSQKKCNKTTHVLDKITNKQRDTSYNDKKQSADSKESRDKNIDLEKESDMANSTQCMDQTKVSSMGTFVPRRIQIPTSAIEYGTQFSIETFQHCQITPFREADRGWKRMNLEIGFHGISCAHCDGRNGKKRGGRCGRYFPSSLKTLADPNKTLFTMYRHLQRCENVAPREKDRLDDLYETHDAERLAQIRGTQKKFYEFIWKELRKGNELTNSNATTDKDSGDDCD